MKILKVDPRPEICSDVHVCINLVSCIVLELVQCNTKMFDRQLDLATAAHCVNWSHDAKLLKSAINFLIKDHAFDDGEPSATKSSRLPVRRFSHFKVYRQRARTPRTYVFALRNSVNKL